MEISGDRQRPASGCTMSWQRTPQRVTRIFPPLPGRGAGAAAVPSIR
ncbi:hypothetical protein KCP71_00060 [Salmonella enterica subsp. enterica]|nr:hypothetical protein KCP71_00060 [Salmonella enterica subsp. enterica]